MSDRSGQASLWKAAVAGIVAGLAASLVMDGFQAAAAALSSTDQDGEPATQQAADKVSTAITGQPVVDEHKGAAGQVVHYALGSVLGLGYGVAAELEPAVAIGGGTVFGAGVALLLDEAAVPAVGLGEAPWRTPASTHAYTLASHLVFGAATELTRRVVRGALDRV